MAVTAPIVTCSRLRMQTDGQGVTTLVYFISTGQTIRQIFAHTQKSFQIRCGNGDPFGSFLR